jgi:DNA-binding NarL/FixJ family response regulator
MAITALIVDDHSFFRRTLRSYLEGARTVEVIGEAADGEEALDFIERLHPQLVIMDINMPRLGGIKAGEIIKKNNPDLPLILYTLNSPEIYLSRSDLHADACLSKERLFEELLTVIEGFTNGLREPWR